MPATLTVSQLTAALSSDQIAAARTIGMAVGEAIDPVAEEIAAACAKVDAYCLGYAPAAALLTGWARDLAAWQISKRVDTPNEHLKTAYERALKELEAVRDGKFSNLPPSAAGAKVSYGGREAVL